MDHLGVETTPERNSIHHEEQHPLPSPSSGRKRKRKLQLEQLALPKSKHKFRHPLVPDDSSEEGMGESETGVELHEGPEQTEGSFTKGGGSSSSSSRLLEGSDITMGEDLEGNGEMSPKMFVPRFEPSASPGSPQGNAFKDTLDSSNSGVMKDALDCQLPVFDADDGESDCRLPVPHVEEGEDEFVEEECLHGPTQEFMLSCEGVGMHTLGLSSAKWSIKQDALPGAERPTIDREFEQYFKVFML